MENYLKLYKPSYGELIYRSNHKGQIQLHKIGEQLIILKIYFPELMLVYVPEDSYLEDCVEVMLTNYAVNFATLEELDGQVLIIPDSWGNEILLTMLNIYDGEPINSKIFIKKISQTDYLIHWTGYYGDKEDVDNNLELKMIAEETIEEIITPLCLYDEELLEYYTNTDR